MNKINEWKPKDIELENNAEIAVKNYTDNLIITAGPGAGKTELLAQKASFLLETNSCSFPKKILAISFKVDSAENLKERVERRVGKDLSKRFDSMTFDAFSKGIMDKFIKGIDESYRPTKEYEIAFDNFDFFYLFKDKLNDDGLEKKEKALKIFKKKVLNTEKSELTFPIINRITEHIFKKNPLILKALQNTYSHIFLDEFQDTTAIQYDLLKTCFKDSRCILTAVGDTKQRIMGWAGALDGIFKIYEKDFRAKKIELISNFRSAPQLVKVQHNIIRALLGDVENLPEAKNTKYNEEEGICKVFEYNTDELEAQKIGEIIGNLIDCENINPRDICIMVRQRAPENTNKIQEWLKELNVYSRIEDEYFSLLKEPIIKIILNIMKISLNEKYPNEYQEIKDFFMDIESVDYESPKVNKIEEKILTITNKVKSLIVNKVGTKDVLLYVLKSIEKTNIQKIYPQYKQDKYLNDILGKFNIKFKEVLYDNNYKEAIEKFEGKNIIPIMTMHKSKGLEFNTVVYVGLEDENLWSINDNIIEETNGFFVAFSRAKYRIIFTSCKQRNGRKRNTRNVEKLYEILERSGIKKEEITH